MNSAKPPTEGAAASAASSGAAARPMPPALGMNIDMNTNMGTNMGMGMGMALGGGGLPTTHPTETVKKKRGRPRKYVGGEPGGTSAAGASPVNMQLALNTPNMSGASSGGSPFTPTGAKRGRGRPPGSGKKYLLGGASSPSAGSWAGQSFTPHIITVAAGEDVATKIYSFAQHGPRAVCVISANGAISTATLRQQSSNGGNVTYEGRYEILSLMGSFLPTGGADSKQRAGGLSVSFACSDGRVVGGGVAGILIAASPIQVVVGSFVSETEKTPTTKEGNGQRASVPGGYAPTSPPSSSAAAAAAAALGLATPASAPRRPPASATPAAAARHHQQSSHTAPPSNLSSGQASQQLPVHQAMGLFQMPWSNPQHADVRLTDINISLPGG